MTSHFLNPKRKQKSPRLAHFAVATLVLLMAAGDRAGARSGWSERSVESVESRSAGDPIMAIVSLRNQRITVYDANGWILRAPVSSGQRGRETPAGVFAIILKEAEHYSNLYDDAYMPNMERITWSGIALHGGALPGYPASHGCVRMPFEFAARLFDATPLGMRVIISPSDVVPVEITHPVLFLSKPGAGALAAIRTAEADDAAKKAEQAARAAGKAFRESAQAMTPVRMAENLKRRAEAELTAAETALGSTLSGEAKEQAEQAKTRAVARIAELQTQLTAARADLQTKRDAVTVARETAVTAENARLAAVEAARQVARELEPVSVLISRKTQRLYVRQAFEPILESPVTILDPDRPIGTHIFPAIERSSGEANLRWSVVSLGGGTNEPHGPVRGGHGHELEPMPRDPDSARAALDRIVIPE